MLLGIHMERRADLTGACREWGTGGDPPEQCFGMIGNSGTSPTQARAGVWDSGSRLRAGSIIRLPGFDRADAVVHSGCVGEFRFCFGIPGRRRMACGEFRKGSGDLKYRCPVAAYGSGCKSRDVCRRMKGHQAGKHGRICVSLWTADRRVPAPASGGGGPSGVQL